MVLLWKDHSARRIELGPLGEAAVDDLLVAVLGGPVDTATGRLIVERTLGDPLFLRELVDGARESGLWSTTAASGACADRCGPLRG